MLGLRLLVLNSSFTFNYLSCCFLVAIEWENMKTVFLTFHTQIAATKLGSTRGEVIQLRSLFAEPTAVNMIYYIVPADSCIECIKNRA